MNTMLTPTAHRRYCSVNEAYTMILKVEKFVDSLAEAYGYDYKDEILEVS